MRGAVCLKVGARCEASSGGWAVRSDRRNVTRLHETFGGTSAYHVPGQPRRSSRTGLGEARETSVLFPRERPDDKPNLPLNLPRPAHEHLCATPTIPAPCFVAQEPAAPKRPPTLYVKSA
jgi:hypothetical protein